MTLAARAWPLVGPLLVLAAFLGIWQAGVFNDLFGLQEFTLPLPSDIVDAFETGESTLVDGSLETFKPALLGYALGNMLGFLLGVALLALPLATATRLSSGFTAVQALPIIAIAPLVALYIGSDTGFKAVTVMIMVFPSMMIYAFRGMCSLEAPALELMSSYDASPRQVFWKLRLPAAVPYILTALKYTTVLALIGVIVCEVLKSRTGLGYVITDAFQGFRTPEAWAAVVILSLAGIVSYSLLGLAERLLFPWTVDRDTDRA